MPFLKEDLAGLHYNWDVKTPDYFTGDPSRRSFDRFDGNQVLFLINFFGTLSEQFSVKEGRRIEELILYYLPSETKSEISVVHWLKTAL